MKFFVWCLVWLGICIAWAIDAAFEQKWQSMTIQLFMALLNASWAVSERLKMRDRA